MPIIPTRITQHTLWQALTGQIPPRGLAAAPIGRAVLDSRDVLAGDLFVALVGQFTDGHRFISTAVERDAAAILCEARGREAAAQAGALIVDCTAGPQPVGGTKPGLSAQDLGRLGELGVQLAFVVPNSEQALQQVGAFQRLHRSRADLRVIGITGSVGKTSTKEMAAKVLANRFVTLASTGNLNNEQGLPLTLLGLGTEHERAVLEMAMYDVGEIARLCELARPHVGVITNVGPSHLERLGTIERIAQAKSELVQALPRAADGGVAILNWDDERVRPMADLTKARIFRYGLTPAADLWAEGIESAGMDGIRFQFNYRAPEKPDSVETLHVRVPLLGRHSVHTSLRAAAVGLVEGLNWQEIVAGLQRNASQLRLVVVTGHNDSTLIDDTYNASPASTIAALNLLLDLHPSLPGRRIAVLGDMRELGSYTEEGHKLVGRRAAGVAQVLVTVGELGRMMAAYALEAGADPATVHPMPDDAAAIGLLKEILQPKDMVLIKGSRAVGMDQIVTGLSQETRN